MMLRDLLFAMGASLIALSMPAFADPVAIEGSGGVHSESGAIGVSPPSLSAPPARAEGESESLALAAPEDVVTVPVLNHIASTGARLL
jgi:hypothetical protein